MAIGYVSLDVNGANKYTFEIDASSVPGSIPTYGSANGAETLSGIPTTVTVLVRNDKVQELIKFAQESQVSQGGKAPQLVDVGVVVGTQSAADDKSVAPQFRVFIAGAKLNANVGGSWGGQAKYGQTPVVLELASVEKVYVQNTEDKNAPVGGSGFKVQQGYFGGFGGGISVIADATYAPKDLSTLGSGIIPEAAKFSAPVGA